MVVDDEQDRNARRVPLYVKLTATNRRVASRHHVPVDVHHTYGGGENMSIVPMNASVNTDRLQSAPTSCPH